MFQIHSPARKNDGFFRNSLFDGHEDSDVPEDMVVPFGIISMVKYLMLNGSFLKYMNWGNENKISTCWTALNRLTVIELTDVSFKILKWLKMSSSWLGAPRTLRLFGLRHTGRPNFEPEVGVCETGHLSDVALNMLWRVYMMRISGKQLELLLIELLLTESAMLEIMDIIGLLTKRNWELLKKLDDFNVLCLE